MSNQNKPDRAKCGFLASGMLSFPKLFPGQADDSQKAGSKAYKLELVTASPSQEMINAIAYVASFYDSAQINPATGQPYFHRHVFGTHGRLKLLHEYPNRKSETYPYAVGKYVIGLSKVVSLKNIKMEGANLADPLVRAEYDRRICENAPKVVKFLNASDPYDLQWVAEENQRRAFANVAPITDATISKTTRPLRSEEIWAGCQVQVYGRCYWEDKIHKTVMLALEQVCLISPGERLAAGQANPDDVFGAFAPASDLAPPSPWTAPAQPGMLALPQANAGLSVQPGWQVQAPPQPAPQQDPWAAFR